MMNKKIIDDVEIWSPKMEKHSRKRQREMFGFDTGDVIADQKKRLLWAALFDYACWFAVGFAVGIFINVIF